MNTNNVLPILVKPAIGYALLKSLKWVVISTLLAFLCDSLGFPSYRWIAFIPALFAFWTFFSIRCKRYEIDDKVIKYTYGILSRNSDSIELIMYQDKSVRRPLLLRLIGLMNLTIMSHDKSHPQFTLFGIERSDLEDVIMDLVVSARNNNGVRMEI